MSRMKRRIKTFDEFIDEIIKDYTLFDPKIFLPLKKLIVNYHKGKIKLIKR